MIVPSGDDPEYTVVRRNEGTAVGGNEEAAVGGNEEPAVGGNEGPAVGGNEVELEYRYGGFKGGKAVDVPDCRISNLKISKSGMSYKWASGGCEALGAANREDYSQTVACAFYWDGRKWVGGKFDWISTSRTTRGWENVKSGYNGWDADAFFGAKRHAFCIVSKDGKKRTNLLEE